MTGRDMTVDVETESFTDGLSDEALDREEPRFCSVPSNLEPDR